MINRLKLIILLLLILIIISFILPVFFFPSDILNYLPSFSQNSWIRPHNSLLADPVYQFEPWKHFAKVSILKGEFPFWNNLNGAGTPFFANPITTVAFPLQFFYYVFSPKVASWIVPFTKLLLLGVFTFLYLRSIKCSPIVSVITVSGIVFSSFMMEWLLWPQTNVFIFFPLILFIFEKIYEGKYLSHRIYLSLIIVVFLAILGGHPGTIIHLSFLSIIYAIFRFWSRKKEIIKIAAMFTLSGFLASFLLIPWFELMFQTTAYHQRFVVDHSSPVPILGIILNYLPFLYGAPHREMYKQISGIYNFQELTSGYVGPAILLFAISGSYFVRKISLVKIWLTISFFSYLVAFNIWPLSLITKIPPLNGISNLRLVSFGAFGILILFAITLEKLRNSNIIISRKYYSNFVVLAAALGFVFFAFEDIFSRAMKRILPEKIVEFYPLLSLNLIMLLFSTLLFVGILIYLFTKKNKLKYTKIFSFLVIPILFQHFFLFWNYNPVSSKSQYYPTTKLIRKLQSLPIGSILEVGNPNLPPNINLFYSLKLAENDYAVNLKKYNEEFDISFPVKNHWNKIDETNPESVNKFGIKYIISDYNINLKKKPIQKEFEKIYPLTEKLELVVPFKPMSNNLKQIRVLTGNYNRKNMCLIKVVLEDEFDKILAENSINCNEVRDKMFYSLNLEADLVEGGEYKLIFKSKNAFKGNRIGFWGDNNGVVYLEALYRTNPDIYKLIWSGKNITLFENPKSDYVSFSGNHTIIHETQTMTAIKVSNERQSILEIKRANYPGWKAFINGSDTKVEKGLFLSVKVPEGDSIIEFKYVPFSFYIGVAISLLGFFILLVYGLRQEIKQKYWKSLKIRWDRFAIKTSKIPFFKHFWVLLCGILLSFLMLPIISKINPIILIPDYSLAINWFVLHNYPRQKDYFLFIQNFLIVLLVPIVLWIVWIIKKHF